jgi:hypothetical protein
VRVKGDKQEVRPLRDREEKKESAEVPSDVTAELREIVFFHHYKIETYSRPHLLCAYVCFDDVFEFRRDTVHKIIGKLLKHESGEGEIRKNGARENGSIRVGN